MCNWLLVAIPVATFFYAYLCTCQPTTNGVGKGKMKKYVENFKAIVYDDFAAHPLKVTFLGNRWWVTTPGEPLQPLDKVFGDKTIGFCFLCEAGGRVGALALAKLLGELHRQFPMAKLYGHRELVCNLKKKDPHYNCAKCKGYPSFCRDAKKSCPSFDVHEYDYIFNDQHK